MQIATTDSAIFYVPGDPFLATLLHATNKNITDIIMPNSALLAISPLDGRYQQKLTPLQNIVSEWGLIRFRVEAEISWLVFLCNQKIAPPCHLRLS